MGLFYFIKVFKLFYNYDYKEKIKTYKNMKKLLTLVVLLMTTFGFAQNLVVNPTFANTLTGWTATGSGYALPTHITNDGQDDTFSVQYVATATTGFDQKFSVVPGATVAISYWYKAARTNGATTGNDMIGKEVINTQINNQLNVSNLTSGIYLARITEDGKTSTTKLVIQ